MYRVTVAVWRGKANDRGRFIFNWIYTEKRFPLDNSGTRGGAIREMRERESRVEEDGRRSTSVEYNRAACSISREIAMEGRMEAAPHEPGILLHEF